MRRERCTENAVSYLSVLTKLIFFVKVFFFKLSKIVMTYESR